MDPKASLAAPTIQAARSAGAAVFCGSTEPHELDIQPDDPSANRGKSPRGGVACDADHSGRARSARAAVFCGSTEPHELDIQPDDPSANRGKSPRGRVGCDAAPS